MKKVIVEEFGDPRVLQVKQLELPEPGPGQVRIAITSIGMNHADLMARRGEYIMSSGFPPFTPGIEGGGVIDAVGDGVSDRKVGDRIILGAAAPKRNNPTKDILFGGTYSTHYVVPAEQTVLAPKAIPDNILGTLWLPFLTAWGCLIWKQKIKAGEFVAIPAASSSVGLAAAQIAKSVGAIPIGLTTSQKKADLIANLPENDFSHLVVTHDHHHKMKPWHKDLRKIARRDGIKMFFDPVASGDYLQTEIHALGQHGTIWVYGLLGSPGPVDVTPLIRKRAAIRGWYLNEISEEGGPALQDGYNAILKGFESGTFRQCIAKTFSLDQVVEAHEELQTGRHIGKFILIPN